MPKETEVIKPAVVWAVIPARYQSTRFPGKPLAPILGKPMIEHVWQRTQSTPEINQTFIATDDDRIATIARNFKASVVLTGHCDTGSQRVALAVQKLSKKQPLPDWVLNIQGDEPTINPCDPSILIQGMKKALAQKQDARMGTLVYPILKQENWESPHVVKVVLNQQQQALYFSRAPIPAGKFASLQQSAWQHIGVYCLSSSFLKVFAELPATPLSQQEKLEQLSVLEHQIPILCFPAKNLSIGVDTPADIARAEQVLKKEGAIPYSHATAPQA